VPLGSCFLGLSASLGGGWGVVFWGGFLGGGVGCRQGGGLGGVCVFLGASLRVWGVFLFGGGTLIVVVWWVGGPSSPLASHSFPLRLPYPGFFSLDLFCSPCRENIIVYVVMNLSLGFFSWMFFTSAQLNRCLQFEKMQFLSVFFFPNRVLCVCVLFRHGFPPLAFYLVHFFSLSNNE